MKKSKFIQLLILAALVVGCKEENLSLGTTSGDTDAISFKASEVLATKGELLTTDNISEMEVFAFYTYQGVWADANSEGYINTKRFMINQLVEKDATTSVWSYTPPKFWPVDANDYISFFAFAPYGEITYTPVYDGDTDTNLPEFSYTLSAVAANNEDLVAGVSYDRNLSNSSTGVDFSLDHLLAKLSFEAKLIGSNESSPDYIMGETYAINGITINGLYPNATLYIDNESGEMTWEINESVDTISLTAAQGQTFRSYDDCQLTPDDDFVSIMGENKGLFMLPQNSATTTTTPTMQVRIRRMYNSASTSIEESTTGNTTLYVIYETEEVEIPNVADWDMFTAWLYQITVDLSKLSDYDTPLVLTAQVMDWTESNIGIEVHNNLYIYSSDNNLTTIDGNATDGYYCEFTICTNYDYNLRVPHHREELDGAITSSRGFLFYTDDFVGTTNNHVTEYTHTSSTTYQGFVPILKTTSGNEIEYATKDNLKDGSYTTTTDDDGETVYYTADGDEITFGSNGYAYTLNTNGLYRLLYYAPNDTEMTAFSYSNDGVYHEIDLSEFEDEEGYISFVIRIYDGYEFDFAVKRTTRSEAGLYTSTAIGSGENTDSSYGVNKEGDDAVYYLRLSVNYAHFISNGGFSDVIGVEMLSNGGGLINQLFPVTLSADATFTDAD